MKDIITIKDDHFEAQISPKFGANVISLKYDGKDIFVPLKDEEQLEINPYIHGSPVLLPANRTYLGKFTFEGKEYSIPINEPRTNANLHGFLLYQAFETESVSENEASFSYENTGEIYPFPFKFTLTYSIKDGKFIQGFDIKNTGDTAMPVTFAPHTTFVEPEIFTMPIDACQEKDEVDIPTGRYVPLNEQEQLYTTGSPSKDVATNGYYRGCGDTARVGDFLYTASKDFDHWITYNACGKAGYICIEPQCGAVNGLNIEGGHRVIKAGDNLYIYTEIKKG